MTRRTRGLGLLAWVLLLSLNWTVPVSAQEMSATISYGAEIRPDLAEKLAYAEAWLQGVSLVAEQAQSLSAVRLAELDLMDQRALAAMQNTVSVRLFNSKLLLDEQGLAYAPDEGEAVARISLQELDEAVLNSSLAKLEQRVLFAEALVHLQDLSEQARLITEAAAQQRSAMRALERQAAGVIQTRVPILRDDFSRLEQLEQIATRLHACFAYLDLLGQGQAWLGTVNAEQVIDQALLVDPDWLPYLIAKAQIMLRQDRTVAAMRLLSAQVLPDLIWSMDEYLQDNLALARSVFRVRQDMQVRFLQMRSLSLLGSAEPDQAEADLNQALDLRPDQATLWLSRGAVRQVKQDFENMCLDYYQACRLGLCLGLSTAQDNGLCKDQQ